MTDFFQMSGYAAYVWSCYGLTLAVLIGLWISARLALRRALSRAYRLAAAAEQAS